MINSETFIIKRDGKKEAFSLDKIKNAISKAFLSVGSFATQDVITNILSRVNISNGTSVEDIQNQVEVALMAEHYYSVAKAFMLYRQKHLEDREVRDKLRFLMDYCDASNPATGSKYDANANVENKNIATLIGELFRMFIIILSEFFFYEIIHIHQKFRCGTGTAEHTRYDKYHVDESSAERLQIGGCCGVTAYGCGSADQPWIHGDACAIIGKIGFIILVYEVLVQQFDVAI